MKLHLGVMDIPYENENTTTGDVAELLEKKYHIMQTFFDRYGDDIAQMMSNDLAAGLESLMLGEPVPVDPFAESMSQVHHLFSAFLYNKEMDGLTGIPTQRALKGISKRFKNRQGPKNRASFIDTGDFERSMRAWVSGVLNAFPQ